jgi:hypothetical protein
MHPLKLSLDVVPKLELVALQAKVIKLHVAGFGALFAPLVVKFPVDTAPFKLDETGIDVPVYKPYDNAVNDFGFPDLDRGNTDPPHQFAVKVVASAAP